MLHLITEKNLIDIIGSAFNKKSAINTADFSKYIKSQNR